MEAVAWVAGEPHSDRPQCASPVMTAMLRSWNDSMSDEDRGMLRPLVPRLVGTDATAEVEDRRAWMAVDWLVREYLPAWLDFARLTADAERVRALPEVTSETVSAAMTEILSARGSADAAWAAARAAARDAAGDAAWAAAGDAAWAAAGAAARAAAWAASVDAAGDAAGAAAWSAARAAAGAAAWSAAWAAYDRVARDDAGFLAGAVFKPTVQELQASALRLVERMIEVQP